MIYRFMVKFHHYYYYYTYHYPETKEKLQCECTKIGALGYEFWDSLWFVYKLFINQFINCLLIWFIIDTEYMVCTVEYLSQGGKDRVSLLSASHSFSDKGWGGLCLASIRSCFIPSRQGTSPTSYLFSSCAFLHVQGNCSLLLSRLWPSERDRKLKSRAPETAKGQSPVLQNCKKLGFCVHETAKRPEFCAFKIVRS